MYLLCYVTCSALYSWLHVFWKVLECWWDLVEPFSGNSDVLAWTSWFGRWYCFVKKKIAGTFAVFVLLSSWLSLLVLLSCWLSGVCVGLFLTFGEGCFQRISGLFFSLFFSLNRNVTAEFFIEFMLIVSAIIFS